MVWEWGYTYIQWVRHSFHDSILGLGNVWISYGFGFGLWVMGYGLGLWVRVMGYGLWVMG